MSKTQKKTLKIRVLLDEVERTAKVKLDSDEGYVILTLDDPYGTEIKFDWANIEELAKKMKERNNKCL